MAKKLLISVCISFVLFSLRSGVNAFATFNWVGGTVHQNISTSALTPLGISENSFQIIDDGNTSQDYVGTKKFTTASHHFDDNRLADGVEYINEELNKAINSAANADKDKKAWKETLYTFGELAHTVQDFYAHSNYVEYKLKDNLAQNPGDIPLPNWDEIAKLKPSRTGLKSGYFFYRNAGDNEKTNFRRVSANMVKREYPGTNFLSDGEFAEAAKDFDGYIKYATETPIDVLHRDINKDNGESFAGKKVNPVTGKTIFDYAFNLAMRETDREWKRLEEGIKEKYPEKSGRIIASLKKGVGNIKVLRGQFLEKILVPADNSEPAKSLLALNKGEYYVIEASGAYSCWEDKTDGVDAYYCDAEWRVGPKPVAWQQLLLDDVPMFKIAEENGDATDYNPNHVYSTYLAGKGNTLKLQISDAIGSSSDNHGGLEVKIYRGIVQ